MMRLSKWRDLERGEVLVERGAKMDRIVLLAAGSIDSYLPPASTVDVEMNPKMGDVERYFARSSRSRAEMSTPVSKESSPEQTAI